MSRTTGDEQKAPLLAESSSSRQSRTGSLPPQHNSDRKNDDAHDAAVVISTQTSPLMSSPPAFSANAATSTRNSTAINNAASPPASPANSGSGCYNRPLGETIRGIYAPSAVPDKPGVTIELADLSIVHTPTIAESLSAYWNETGKFWKTHDCANPCAADPFIVVRSAIGQFLPSQIHAVTTTSLSSAEAIVGVLLGEEAVQEGSVTVNGLPMPEHFRYHCGVVDMRASWSVDSLTVRENLMFAATMRRPTIPAGTFEERSSYLARLFHLDVSAKAERLSVMMRLRLDIAMELMIDPPVLVLVHPFEALDRHSHAQLSNTLIVAATVLQKTVIVTMSSLPLTLVPALDTVLLLAADGHCLYSGPREGLFTFFTKLELPPLIQHRAGRSRPSSSRNLNQSGAGGNTRTSLDGNTLSGTLSKFDENTADAVMDQVRAWVSSPAELSRYASKFYDSTERRRVAEVITRTRRAARGGAGGGGGNYSPRAGTPASAEQELATNGNNSIASNHDTPAPTAAAAAAVVISGGYGTNDAATLSPPGAQYSPRNDGGTVASLPNFYDMTTTGNGTSSAPGHVAITPTSELSKPQHPRNAVVAWFLALFEYVTTMLKSRLTYVETYIYWVCLVLVLVFCAWLLQKQHTDTGTQNIEGIFFLLFTVTTMINMAALQEIYHGKGRYQMMARGGVLGPVRYFVVSLLEVLVSRTLLGCIVAAACRVMIPNVNIKVFVVSVGVLSFAHYSLLFMICTLSPELWLSNLIMTFYTAFSILFAGYFLNVNSQGVSALSSASIMRYPYGYSVKEFVDDNVRNTTAKRELQELGFAEDNLSTFSAVLVIVAVAAWLIVFMKLKFDK